VQRCCSARTVLVMRVRRVQTDTQELAPPPNLRRHARWKYHLNASAQISAHALGRLDASARAPVPRIAIEVPSAHGLHYLERTARNLGPTQHYGQTTRDSSCSCADDASGEPTLRRCRCFHLCSELFLCNCLFDRLTCILKHLSELLPRGSSRQVWGPVVGEGEGAARAPMPLAQAGTNPRLATLPRARRPISPATLRR
jgi:hypothetical protein